MQVFLIKDVIGIGFEGQIVKVKDGLARNLLIPKGQAVQITRQNEAMYRGKECKVVRVKEGISSKTSMLAETIRSSNIIIKKRAHDGGLLYAAIRSNEVIEALDKAGIKVKKSQIVFDKSVKKCGIHKVTVRLSSTLMAQFTLTIKPE
ncbi:50S ribosomal protein L9 [bacterium]|jgi:large subunit ribosomal protein L9|nr:50S ribosomal protein L9 [bacterium]MBT3903600.1 50S ribosomal protein L9 [bacterium]MBT4577874.1 50S ribosomal protein L9 [bacterium]MBT5345947.1 50S ribosomal protein L9 [bacterium]MBT6130733.1 50S ribosomal protein L9 [bacterium]